MSKKYLILGSVLKDEHKYMKDFVKYHRHVGVEKFVFFDREYNKLKEMFKDDVDIEVFLYPENPRNTHTQAWADIINYCRGKSKWLALIDADEALVPEKEKDVKNILKNYEEYASLQLNWHTFGSSGRIDAGSGSVYERFLKRAKWDASVNSHTQFICQPDRCGTTKSHTPHNPNLPKNEMSVNTNKEMVVGPFNSPPIHDVLWVAHYFTKSQEEWMLKRARGRCDIFNLKRPLEDFNSHDSISNEVVDTTVLNIWNSIVE